MQVRELEQIRDWAQNKFFPPQSLEWKFLSDGCHLGHVTLTIYIIHSPFLRMLHMTLGSDWPNDFREEDI